MRKCLTLLLLLLALRGSAQQDKVILHCTNAETGRGLSGVTISANGSTIATSDSAGYAVASLARLSAGHIVAYLRGYRPDTIASGTTEVRLHPLSAVLREATVWSSKISKLLRDNNEYVVDYAVLADRIVVASYSGNNGGHAKLWLLDKSGTVLSACKLPEEPTAIYKSCTGVYYCVATHRFYTIDAGDGTITTGRSYSSSLLPGLQQCQQAMNGNLYYKLADRRNFNVVFGKIPRGDSVVHPFLNFYERDVAFQSMLDWMDVLELLAQGQVSRAAEKQLARLSWDRMSFSHIDMPLLAQHDTLMIFDYFKRKLLRYNEEGRAAGAVPLSFAWQSVQEFHILTDEATGRIYIHRYADEAHQTIEELDTRTGTVSGNAVAIGKPYAEDVQVYDGDIYFLWMDKTVPATRQLFVQHEGQLFAETK
jgi:hypothetical protein